MNIKIISPTIALLSDNTDIENIKRELSYINKSISFQINKFKKLRWLKNKDPIGYDARLRELNSKLKNTLVFRQDGKYAIRPGSIPYINTNIKNITNSILYPKLQPVEFWEDLPFTPYDYQKESVENLLKVKHGNISLPTGAGKSLILLMLSQRIGKDIVVVTPSKSIFRELLSLFKKHLGNHMVGGYGDGNKNLTKPITIAIGKSLTMIKKGSAAYRFFSKKKAMLIDESHTFAASQLEKICHGILKDIPYRIFVSATQTRNDGTEKLLQSIIGKNVLEMNIKDATDRGFLCPLRFYIMKTFSKDTRQTSDPLEMKRIHFLYNENIAELYAKIANASWLIKKESSLILVEELHQIKMLVDRLKVPFVYAHSGSKVEADKFNLEKVDVTESVEKFNNGEARVLIGTKCISTGTNIYPTHNAMNWVGGSSEIVTKQGIMGRSTRILENSKYTHLHKKKPYTKIYDCVVEGQININKQLKQRIIYYQESGGKIKYI